MRDSTLLEMQVLAGITGDGIGQHFENRQAQAYRRPLEERSSDGLGRVVERGPYAFVRTLSLAVFGLYKAVGAMRTALDAIAYTTPELTKSANALRDGALDDLDDLVKASGFALDSSFTEGYRYRDRSEGELGGPYCDSLAACLFDAVGELARVKALAKEAAPRLKKGGSELYETDLESAVQALAELGSKGDALIEKLRTAISNLAAEAAKAST